MSRTKCDSSINSNPWCQDDYRNGSQFRGKQMSSMFNTACDGTWDKDQKFSPTATESKLKKYSLVIVLPSGNSDQNTESETSNSQSNMTNVQMDSGIGSMSPSPPKTPTPDYDSLEDSYEEAHSPTQGIPIPKKVHFSIVDDGDYTLVHSPRSSKSSWRDLLVHDPLDCNDHLSYCYRQDWVNGETKTKSRSKGISKHQYLSTTILNDLEQISERSSRSDVKRRSGTKLVRRASSLDRFAELRYSYRYHDQIPLLCDPDPLKTPSPSYGKRKSNRKSRIPKTSER
ncbi:uncharacterized protein TNCT_686231 [Trichonephila clavata]|uniref:Uncharacterized protein n=1 Tax=Trichonephila clavata TaxID=2740835 RepID=A0A8X6LFM3_TRICU|nr:uncharacterized protein TNCT_686231 [Trichonephila clavata]